MSNVIRLTKNALNYALNMRGDPSAHFPGVASIDIGSMLRDPSNLALVAHGAVMLFLRIPKRRDWYDAHFIAPAFPSSPTKGPAAFRECVDSLFTQRRALGIQGLTPVDNRAARLMARWLGAEAVGLTTDGIGRQCVVYELTRERFHGLSERQQAV